jgi:peptide-methionine (S)-S-oxide reductase
MFSLNKDRLVEKTQALPGRATPLSVSARHMVLGNTMQPPFPAGLQQIQFGLGCFWGAERLFWELDGVFTTAAGYGGGYTVNPTYQEVCSGQTAHTELVLVVFDPAQLSLDDLLQTFWEAHNPTQGMRQGNDSGTQYRSAIYASSPEQLAAVQLSVQRYQQALKKAGLGTITTEVRQAGPFYYAEDYHQQYLAKNPDGYCGLRGTGVTCPNAS